MGVTKGSILSEHVNGSLNSQTSTHTIHPTLIVLDGKLNAETTVITSS